MDIFGNFWWTRHKQKIIISTVYHHFKWGICRVLDGWWLVATTLFNHDFKHCHPRNRGTSGPRTGFMVMYHGLDAPSQAITPSHLFACWVKQFETVDETNTLSSLDRLVKQNSSDLHPCSVGNLQHIGGSHPACLPAMRRPRRVGGAVTTYFVRLHGPKKKGPISQLMGVLKIHWFQHNCSSKWENLWGMAQ